MNVNDIRSKLRELLRAPTVGGYVVSTRMTRELRDIIDEIAKEYDIGASTLLRLMIIYALLHRDDFEAFVKKLMICSCD